jgi:hypothetical protein
MKFRISEAETANRRGYVVHTLRDMQKKHKNSVILSEFSQFVAPKASGSPASRFCSLG